MLSSCLVEQINRLLALGNSRRDVARIVGVSRTTVNRIAARERPDLVDPVETDLSSLPRRKAKRCATCGGMVYPPCRLCRMRAKLADRAKAARRESRAQRPASPSATG
jgi:hypothetical protein